MRIALISEHASPLATLGGVDSGGQNTYVAHVARSLAKRGHHVDVLTRRDDASLPAAVDLRPGVRVLHIPAGPAHFVPKEQLLAHMPAFTRAARQLLAHSVPYDVVHANFFMSGLVGLRLKASFGLPLVMTFHALGLVRREHQGSADAFPPMRTAIEERIVRLADRVVAECPQDRLDLLRLYGADERRIVTVPCGVDLEEFSPVDKARARRRLGLAPDDFVVLQLGRLVPRKGVDNVVRAVAQLQHVPKLKLLIVGGDAAEPDERLTPEIGRLRALAHDLGVADRVVFTGQRRREQLPECYGAADVFVTTPWYEPFGITPLEAMACGVPVIGSDVGGIKYSVDDGVTGFLVPPRDPAALAQRIAHLHDNPVLAHALGRAGIRRVRAMFTWDRVADELLGVYQGVRRPREAAAVPAAELKSQPGAMA
ncbi:glycosyltransferase family 1 protein [Azohydromonas sp. G-1-1-14]|uniref:Glycosyltransferase family 1 protein n=1 Tax=Azohydromonas caseinilytica TaxID=2728836 RepID=A0A848F498_9BURK|nr:glycosyltransferase family 1 protein [Azohydromonas caseinilytica]NML13545.1 glycosyltransferase family 1 protein [Azohydromonas caseinilytica]